VAKTETVVAHNVTNDADDSDLETFADSDTEDNKGIWTSKPERNMEESEPCHTQQTTTKETNEIVEDYRLYLGPENGSKVELVIRYPNGSRENITFPSDSQLKVFIRFKNGLLMGNFLILHFRRYFYTFRPKATIRMTTIWYRIFPKEI
jgi:hypothetical protein